MQTATDAGSRDDVTVVVVEAIGIRPPVDALTGAFARTNTRVRWRT